MKLDTECNEDFVIQSTCHEQMGNAVMKLDTVDQELKRHKIRDL